MSTCAEKFDKNTDVSPPSPVFPAGVQMRLPTGRFFRIQSGDGLKLIAQSGQFWITAEGEGQDFVLEGESALNLDGLKTLLIEALCGGEFHLMDRNALLTGVDGTGDFHSRAV